MLNYRLVLTGLAMLATGVASASADVKLPAIFGDNMVLQRDARAAVWGWAEPGEQVTVKVGDREAAAKADESGKWKLELAPMKAGGPVELSVSGKNTITLKNVLIGDVWVGSGQSNIDMPLSGAKNAAEEISTSAQPQIRLFNMPNRTAETPQADCAGRWVVCEPKRTANFSAVMYFFGRDLFKALAAPVGLIHTGKGGTPIDGWISRAGYEAEPKIKPILDRWDASLKAARDKAAPILATRPDAKVSLPVATNLPTCLFNAKIAPLIPLTIKGVIWYQGESNANNAALYRVQMPALIADWRKLWGRDFPFFQVQLANFQATSAQPVDAPWARLREAQLKTWQSVKNTGMVVLIDVGDAHDIHPKDKQTVGARLVLQVRAIAYGEKGLVYSGPVYKTMKVEGNTVRLTFDHVGSGLAARYRPGQTAALDGPAVPPLSGFAVAGEDRTFIWAEARIDGNVVIVSSDKVQKPLAVRYGWDGSPNCNLYNQEGLPATPFRTDDWPVGK